MKGAEKEVERLRKRLRELELAAVDLYDGSFADADAKYCHYLNCYPDAVIDSEEPSPDDAHNTPEELEQFKRFREGLRDE